LDCKYRLFVEMYEIGLKMYEILFPLPPPSLMLHLCQEKEKLTIWLVFYRFKHNGIPAASLPICLKL
jgi:hypothetical protein